MAGKNKRLILKIKIKVKMLLNVKKKSLSIDYESIENQTIDNKVICIPNETIIFLLKWKAALPLSATVSV